MTTRTVALRCTIALSALCLPLSASEPPPVPTSTAVLAASDLSVSSLSAHEASFAMGRTGKEGPLGFGESITAGAIQKSVLERVTDGGREVLRRTHSVTRPGNDDVLMRARIDVDPETLLPLRSRTEQGPNITTIDYNWQTRTVRSTPGADGSESSETKLDMEMFEVGAHDIWIAALPLAEGFSARIPTYFASTGTKYWAVPRVVGSEPVDIGDGVRRDSWVVELDWWGMGADNTADNHSSGGGANDTAGAGGKYWVLKTPVAGLPSVVRVRTEVSPEADSVIQLQADL